MGIGVNQEDYDRIQGKLAGMFVGMEPDLKLVGEVGAEAIVRTTLAGIGENDQSFAPYSPGYQALLDAVGGKPRQTVDLRGLFYKEGQTPKKYRSEKSRRREGEGRQAYIDAAFKANGTDVAFNAKTGITRPQMGVTDPRSEMSLDLIRAEPSESGVAIIYEPRAEEYMITHQNGDGKAPKRTWFTASKQAVRAGLLAATGIIIKARAAWFNDHGESAPAPQAGPDVKDGGDRASRDAQAGI